MASIIPLTYSLSPRCPGPTPILLLESERTSSAVKSSPTHHSALLVLLLPLMLSRDYKRLVPGQMVFIKVGSVVPFPECMYDTQNLQTRQQCQQGQKPVLCQELLPNDFVIDWCNVTLVDELEPSPTPRIYKALEFEGDFNPPPEDLDGINYIPDYLLTFLLPTLIALLLCALLSYIMCCRREGVLQLVHQQSIFSNTEELRKMAASRDFPRPLSTLPMFNARTGEGTSPMDLAGDSARVPLILSQQ